MCKRGCLLLCCPPPPPPPPPRPRRFQPRFQRIRLEAFPPCGVRAQSRRATGGPADGRLRCGRQPSRSVADRWTRRTERVTRNFFVWEGLKAVKMRSFVDDVACAHAQKQNKGSRRRLEESTPNITAAAWHLKSLGRRHTGTGLGHADVFHDRNNHRSLERHAVQRHPAQAREGNRDTGAVA